MVLLGSRGQVYLAFNKKEGFYRFRYFDTFMPQKQVLVADFLLAIPMICGFVRGNKVPFKEILAFNPPKNS